MAGRDASRVQLDFPQLVADVIRQLNLTGTVGLLEFSDQVTPVYIVAQRAGALAITQESPVFTSAGVQGDHALDPVSGTIIVDSGPLAAGDYDIWGAIEIIAINSLGVNGPVVLQHRDAANVATLANLLQVVYDGVSTRDMTQSLPVMGYNIGLNERLRVEVAGGNVTGIVSTVVGFQLRPTP